MHATGLGFTLLLAIAPCLSALRLQAKHPTSKRVSPSSSSQCNSLYSRRSALLGATAAALLPLQAATAVPSSNSDTLLADLRAVVTALEPLPALLDDQKWDAVRSVLKTPPVGNLWNLGDSKNTIRKLADLRDDVELFEAADDVASALQLADQYTYDNNFIYYQPGNGKVKIKEPKQQVVLASKLIKDIISAN